MTKYLREESYDVTFLLGEIELGSMITQLKQEGMKDGRFRYNADGIIKDNKSNTKILLTEVSSDSVRTKLARSVSTTIKQCLARFRWYEQLHNYTTKQRSIHLKN